MDILDQLSRDLANTDALDLQSLDRGNRAMAAAESDLLRERLLAEAHVISTVFDNPSGRACLDLLLRKTMLLPQSPEEATADTAERYAILMARREGQRELIFDILGAIAVARGEREDGDV